MKHPSTRSRDHIPRAPDAARMRGGMNVAAPAAVGGRLRERTEGS
jgi:hypothetical protein